MTIIVVFNSNIVPLLNDNAAPTEQVVLHLAVDYFGRQKIAPWKDQASCVVSFWKREAPYEVACSNPSQEPPMPFLAGWFEVDNPQRKSESIE